jgi:tetraacyldisaccharide 4'-kinase
MRPLSGLVWSAAASALGPGLRIMLWRRARRGKEIAARLDERRGIETMKRPAGKLLWLHAASVGEAVSALPLLAALPADVFTVFTTGTVTSAKLLEARLPQLGLQGRVVHRFVPLDVPGWAARFLRHWRPDAACFLENELWPNMLAACRRRRIPLALVNARFSVRSAETWARVPGLAQHVLGAFAWIAAQSEADAQRLRALGAERVDVPGNLKFSAPTLPADPTELARLLALAGARPRWLAASTHPADDAMVARVHRALLARHPGLLTAVAPRHPERGGAVAAAMGGAPRRSLGEDFSPAHPAWVADTIGELGLLYRVFPIVFMGKSFAAGGGQNFLEPARLGCAVATGPATENFAQARDIAVAAGALSVVKDEAALTAWLDARLLANAPVAAFAPTGDLPGLLAARLVALMGPGGTRIGFDPEALAGVTAARQAAPRKAAMGAAARRREKTPAARVIASRAMAAPPARTEPGFPASVAEAETVAAESEVAALPVAAPSGADAAVGAEAAPPPDLATGPEPKANGHWQVEPAAVPAAPEPTATRLAPPAGRLDRGVPGIISTAIDARPMVQGGTMPPRFWRHDGWQMPGLLLSPLSGVVSAVTARRIGRRGWRAPVPVICCGNAVIGGSGKTTLALDLAQRLQARGVAVHLLTRGYGGSARGVLRVDPARHDATLVGDEALLLAARAPTWRAADRAAAARQAIIAGAEALVLDDGMQNPTLAKTLSLLVVDGGFGFGNGRVLPAGPLREKIRAAALRAGAAVLIGADETGALARLPSFLPVLRARLAPGAELASLAGKRVVAFAGIGRPEKFFSMLEQGGARLVDRLPFPDHHRFATAELARILGQAHDLEAIPVTTRKDFVRIPSPLNRDVVTVGVSLEWEDEGILDRLLDRALRLHVI